jgi:hypothetical protein
MAVTYENGVRTAIATAVMNDIDNGTGNGTLVFETSGDAEVATITFAATCGTVTTGVLTFSGWTNDTSAAGGTIEHASFYDGQGSPEKLFEVPCNTTGGTNIIQVSSTSVASGETMTLTSLTWTMPASVG